MIIAMAGLFEILNRIKLLLAINYTRIEKELSHHNLETSFIEMGGDSLNNILPMIKKSCTLFKLPTHLIQLLTVSVWMN